MRHVLFLICILLIRHSFRNFLHSFEYENTEFTETLKETSAKEKLLVSIVNMSVVSYTISPPF